MKWMLSVLTLLVSSAFAQGNVTEDVAWAIAKGVMPVLECIDVTDRNKVLNVETFINSAEKTCNLGKSECCTLWGSVYFEPPEWKESVVRSRTFGVEADNLKAFEIFKKACEGNDARGCSVLGMIYAGGFDIGVEPDMSKALEIFDKLCKLHDEKSCEMYSELKKQPQ
ncbi:MAG: hypothetical protein LBU53_06030 [Zoogloeaceae bacterium]|jgi:hypothetical protein|nr:hypothetical protein [Zoogloeaceae bacterium]